MEEEEVPDGFWRNGRSRRSRRRGCCGEGCCCCCLELSLGVKVLGLFMVLVEVVNVSLVVELKPHFIFFVVPASSVGLLCHILLLVAAIFGISRWLCVPWLIYAMLVVVCLGLASVLQVVLPLTSDAAADQDSSPSWPPAVLLGASATLALAGLYLYFWTVVLELFIQMGPSPPPPPPHPVYHHRPPPAEAAVLYMSPTGVHAGVHAGAPGGFSYGFPPPMGTVYRHAGPPQGYRQPQHQAQPQAQPQPQHQPQQVCSLQVQDKNGGLRLLGSDR